MLHLLSTQIWPMCNKGITQFYLPPTHKPYLPLLPSHKVSPLYGWYSMYLPTKGWPDWVGLGGSLHTEINVRHQELNPDTVTPPSTYWAQCMLMLLETNVLTLPRLHRLVKCQRVGLWTKLCSIHSLELTAHMGHRGPGFFSISSCPVSVGQSLPVAKLAATVGMLFTT